MRLSHGGWRHFIRLHTVFLTLVFLAGAALRPTAAAPASFQQVGGLMSTGRFGSSMAVLPSGKILIAGGSGGISIILPVFASAEIYDPKTGQFTLSKGHLNVGRTRASATVLPNGKVLIAGGQTQTTVLPSAELYDPASDSFTTTGMPMSVARTRHGATLLNNGTVLIAGGVDANGDALDSAEIYDPKSDTFTTLANHMTTARSDFGAVLLEGGQVLLVGGTDSQSNTLASAELYDPASMSFTETSAPMNFDRADPVATLVATGEVLVTGGLDSKLKNLPTSDIYDPQRQIFFVGGQMSSGRVEHFAVPLPSGQVLVGGGYTNFLNAPTASVDLYDPIRASFRATGEPMHIGRAHPNGALLANGKILIVGGVDNQGTLSGLPLADGELYDPVLDSFTMTGGLNAPRTGHTATLLSSGKVLIVGGANGAKQVQSTAELYNPRLDTFAPTSGPLNAPRVGHTAVRLANGKVLIVGGSGDRSAEIYNPATDTFTLSRGQMTAARTACTATPLANNMVLIAGGLDPGGNGLSTAEVYDPRADSFSATKGLMTTPRALHAAVRLRNGKILLVGGSTNSGFANALDSAELYDPKSLTFTAAKSMEHARAALTATLLGNGQVLVAGGADQNSEIQNSAELFAPATGGFTPTAGPMTAARIFHTATAVKNMVLLAGGDSDPFNATANTDLYNPRTRSFSAGPELTAPRDLQTATPLKRGRVLITGGRGLIANQANVWPTAELYLP